MTRQILNRIQKRCVERWPDEKHGVRVHSTDDTLLIYGQYVIEESTWVLEQEEWRLFLPLDCLGKPVEAWFRLVQDRSDDYQGEFETIKKIDQPVQVTVQFLVEEGEPYLSLTPAIAIKTLCPIPDRL